LLNYASLVIDIVPIHEKVPVANVRKTFKYKIPAVDWVKVNDPFII
jgi:hypothetical protein